MLSITQEPFPEVLAIQLNGAQFSRKAHPSGEKFMVFAEACNRGFCGKELAIYMIATESKVEIVLDPYGLDETVCIPSERPVELAMMFLAYDLPYWLGLAGFHEAAKLDWNEMRNRALSLAF